MRVLTPEQQELVVRHMGLVKMHVRRQERRLYDETRRRLHDDLVQEGYLGLMDAASRYEADEHGPFASFALRYIHGAICRFLVSQMDGLSMSDREIKRFVETRKRADATMFALKQPLPYFFSLQKSVSAVNRQTHRDFRRRPAPEGRSEGPGQSLEDCTELPPASRRRMQLSGNFPAGIRLRRRYEHAVQWALDQVRSSPRSRPDRIALVDAIVQERLLVPDDRYRSTKRQLADRFGSSLGRLTQCENRLLKLMRLYLLGGADHILCAEASSPADDIVHRPANLLDMTGPQRRRRPREQDVTISDVRRTW